VKAFTTRKPPHSFISTQILWKDLTPARNKEDLVLPQKDFNDQALSPQKQWFYQLCFKAQ
jgi:hypothetical protein